MGRIKQTGPVNQKTVKRSTMMMTTTARKNNVTKKHIDFESALKIIKQFILKNKPYNLGDAIKLALSAAKQLKNKMKPRSKRIIPVPKVGGILPLIPIFAGLSALGALSGGAAGIAKAVNDARSAKQQLEEANRHNKTMEAIAMGKGLYLKPYKTGLGVFLRPPQPIPLKRRHHR